MRKDELRLAWEIFTPFLKELEAKKVSQVEVVVTGERYEASRASALAKKKNHANG